MYVKNLFRDRMMGSIETVLGPIPQGELGKTLMPNDLSDLTRRFREPRDPDKKMIVDMPISIETSIFPWRNLHFSRDNLRLEKKRRFCRLLVGRKRKLVQALPFIKSM
jgi:hypothetical protein